MTQREELNLIITLIQKYNLPLSPILEYAIKEREEQCVQESDYSGMVSEPIYVSEQNKELDYYLFAFSQLSVGASKGKKLPHKAILLIAIMNLIENGAIEYNRIELTHEIADEFSRCWKKFTGDSKVPSVWTPFWYMKSEHFWHFKPKENEELLHALLMFAGHPSIGQMRPVITYAYFDKGLFQYMENDSCRQKLKDVLMKSFLETTINEPFHNDQDAGIGQTDTIQTDNICFYVKSQKGAYGIGVYCKENNTFKLLKGSIISSTISNAFNRQATYNEIINNYCNYSEGKYLLKMDYVFKSPSTASSVVLGRSSNGWLDWKNKEGKSLDDVFPRR